MSGGDGVHPVALALRRSIRSSVTGSNGAVGGAATVPFAGVVGGSTGSDAMAAR